MKNILVGGISVWRITMLSLQKKTEICMGSVAEVWLLEDTRLKELPASGGWQPGVFLVNWGSW